MNNIELENANHNQELANRLLAAKWIRELKADCPEWIRRPSSEETRRPRLQEQEM